MATWGDGRIDLILRGTDYAVQSLRHKWWTGKEWKPSKDGWNYVTLNNLYMMSEPAVITWGNSLFLLFNNVNSALKLAIYDRNTEKWGSPEDIQSGLHFTGTPAVVSSTSWVKVVLVGIKNNHLYEVTYDGKTWSRLTDMGESFAEPPKLVSWGPDRVDAFAKGIDGILYRNTWKQSSGWEGWSDMGLPKKIISPPNAVSWGKDRIDIFAIAEGGVLCRSYYDGLQWGDWNIDTSGQYWTGIPGAASSGSERLDLFLIDPLFFVGHIWYDDQNGWHEPPQPLVRLASRHIGRRVTAVSSVPGRVDVFAVELDGTIAYQHWSKGMGWQPSISTCEKLGGPSLMGVVTSS